MGIYLRSTPSALDLRPYEREVPERKHTLCGYEWTWGQWKLTRTNLEFTSQFGFIPTEISARLFG